MVRAYALVHFWHSSWHRSWQSCKCISSAWSSMWRFVGSLIYGGSQKGATGMFVVGSTCLKVSVEQCDFLSLKSTFCSCFPPWPEAPFSNSTWHTKRVRIVFLKKRHSILSCPPMSVASWPFYWDLCIYLDQVHEDVDRHVVEVGPL